MGSTLRRLLLASLSTTLGLLVAYLVLRSGAAPETVALVDNSEEVERLLERRTRGGAGVEPTVGVVRDAGAAPDAGNPTPVLPRDHGDPLSVDAPLLREPLTEEVASTLFATLGPGRPAHIIPDPQCYFWDLPGQQRVMRFPEHPGGEWVITTDDLGFRREGQVLRSRPGLRILVSGDSHTAGVVPAEELFTQRVEDALRASRPGEVTEVLNGGKGGFAFYSYLGVLEKFLELEPDVFVLAAFGGNDFVGSVSPFRYFNRLPPARYGRGMREKVWRREVKESVALIAQGMNHVVAFARRPDDAEVARVAACQALGEILATCEAEGIRFVFVYIPPLTDAQPHLIQEDLERLSEGLRLSPEELAVTERLADEVLAFLEARSVTVVDMRPAFRSSTRPCYWLTDHHINTRGHRLIAEALLPLLATER
jgi:lysophospholipase L1-like esterase